MLYVQNSEQRGNAELIAPWDIKDELQGSFYNITTHCQVIFGNKSLSPELPAGMWQGISSTPLAFHVPACND